MCPISTHIRKIRTDDIKLSVGLVELLMDFENLGLGWTLGWGYWVTCSGT